MINITLFTGFYTCWVVRWISSISSTIDDTPFLVLSLRISFFFPPRCANGRETLWDPRFEKRTRWGRDLLEAAANRAVRGPEIGRFCRFWSRFGKRSLWRKRQILEAEVGSGWKMMFIFNMGVIFRDTAVSLQGFEPESKSLAALIYWNLVLNTKAMNYFVFWMLLGCV